MHKNGRINCPDRVSKSLKAVELVPLTRLSFVDLELYIFSYSIGSTANYDHHRPDEDTGVLISSKRLFLTNFVGSLDPVPTAISVTAQAPGVFQCGLVSRSSSKGHHHTGGRACSAEG